MGLPKTSLPTQVVQVAGQDVQIRGMSRAEVHKIGTDLEAAEAVVISFACDVTVEEAQAWLGSTSADDAQVLIEAVIALSGLGDAPKGSSG